MTAGQSYLADLTVHTDFDLLGVCLSDLSDRAVCSRSVRQSDVADVTVRTD